MSSWYESVQAGTVFSMASPNYHQLSISTELFERKREHVHHFVDIARFDPDRFDLPNPSAKE
jgi:hypothetical protein